MSVHDIHGGDSPPEDPEDPHNGAEPDPLSSSSSRADDLYRIGAVATITGISAERLRAWERRYGVTPAYRAGKTRFYNKAQLERLSKLKQLSDNGQPISSIVELSDAELDARLAAQRQMPRRGGARLPRTGLIGPNLLVLEQQQDAIENFEVAARWANMAAFCSDQEAVDALDIVVVQLPVLLDAQIGRIADFCPEAQVVAVYQYATPEELSLTRERGIITLLWPLDWPQIESAVASAAERQADGRGARLRRYSDEELIAIAVSAREDPAQCPQHLVELITRLNAFADYAAEFAAARAETPEIYEQIQAGAQQARMQLENALAALLQEDSKET